MKLYVIRHGETDWNARRLFQGQINTSLNEKGEEQAREAKKRIQQMGLTFDAVYSSPIDRAARTIEIITGMDRSQFCLDDRLMEVNFGPLDGTPFDKEAPQAGNLFRKPSAYVPPEGAESFQEVEKRVADFLDEIARKHPGERVLAGSHGCTMRIMMQYLGYMPLDKIWDQGIGNCTIVELTSGEDGCFHVTGIYETQDWFGKQKK
jgi:broad specificity phosphatase PhoE